MEYISDPFTLCEKLRKTAQDAFRDAGLEQRGPYGLLDFPNHPNVGDSAIWIGELNYLKSAVLSSEAVTTRCPSALYEVGGA